MNKRLFLHLGAHRTGSTYIQEFFDRNSALLERQGVVYRRLHDFPALRKKVLSARRDSERLRQVYAEVFDRINGLFSEADSVFFSYEGFLGDIYLDRSRRIYPDTRVFCEALERFLAQLEESVEVQAGFCTRDYSSFIVSTYMYAVRQGYTIDLERYVKKLDLSRFSWCPVVEPLYEVFGGRLSLWEFGDFRREPWAILRHLLEALGVDAAKLRSRLDFSREASNPTAGEHSLEVQRAFNESLSRADVPAEVRRKVRAGVNRKVTSLLAKQDRKLVIENAQVKDTLDSQYERDLATLKRRFPESYIPVDH